MPYMSMLEGKNDTRCKDYSMGTIVYFINIYITYVIGKTVNLQNYVYKDWPSSEKLKNTHKYSLGFLERKK